MKVPATRIDQFNVHASCPQCSWPASGREAQVCWRLDAHLEKVHGNRNAEVALRF